MLRHKKKDVQVDFNRIPLHFPPHDLASLTTIASDQ